jgi:hypothetical protein
MQKFRRQLLSSRLGQVLLKRHRTKELAAWEAAGRIGRTPYLTKIVTIRRHASEHSIRVFVETGTYLGEMINAQEGNFDRLLSVELDPELYRNAVRRFRRLTKISVFQGDSSVQLPLMVATVSEPALFWLDAHYSKGFTARGEIDTPILGELELVLQRQYDDVILIDDAENFDGTNDYPTITELESIILNRYPDRSVTCVDSIICVTRK